MSPILWYNAPVKDIIPFTDFEKVDLRVGKILEASLPEGSEKLIKLSVDFSEEFPKTVFTGLKSWYNPEYFEGKLFVFVYNLEPRKMMGEESQGMLLAVDSLDGPKPLVASEGAIPGEKIN